MAGSKSSDHDSKSEGSVNQVKLQATVTLPEGGKKLFTKYMQGEAEVPKHVERFSPICMASTSFEDGTKVIVGVNNSGQEDFNIKFAWVFDAEGKLHTGWPIDTGDHEDFEGKGYLFYIGDDESKLYELHVKDKGEKEKEKKN